MLPLSLVVMVSVSVIEAGKRSRGLTAPPATRGMTGLKLTVKVTDSPARTETSVLTPPSGEILKTPLSSVCPPRVKPADNKVSV